MYETILIILILILATIAFNLTSAQSIKAKRQAQMYKRAASAMKDDNPDQKTIDLIGEEAYKAMTERIDKILRIHSHEPCITLNLTCGPDTREGSTELHTILPGTPLQLNMCKEGGVETVDIYNNGSRIGRLALLEAMTIKEIMKKNTIRAAYVAEQNCYGIEDSLQMAIIVFYEPKTKTKPTFTQAFTDFKEKRPKDIGIIDICEN